MTPIPRNRRKGGQNTDKSTKAKEKEKREEGLRWQHYVTFLILAAILFTCSVYFYHAVRRTYPAKLEIAQCLFEESAPFFVPCKDREQHNKEFLQYTLDSASDLTDESFASASVTYMMSLAMRSKDIELGKELFRWMLVPIQSVECTRLISIEDIDFQKETPRGLCAEAYYRNPDVRNHKQAVEDLNLFYDMLFLMSIYGSELHEGAIRYTADVQLYHKGEPKYSPRFAGLVHSYYTRPKLPPTPYAFLLDELAQSRNLIEHERQGVHLLAIELEKTITTMRKCNPPANLTWMEYHSRAAFKSEYYKGTDDECGWTTAEDSFWEKIKLAYYDFNFRFRWMLGKI